MTKKQIDANLEQYLKQYKSIKIAMALAFRDLFNQVTKEKEDRYNKWRKQQNIVPKNESEEETWRKIFDAMDEEDKKENKND